MSSTNPSNPEFPFTAHARSADRDLLLAGIVETVWESVLGLPILLRAPEDLDGHPGGATLTASLQIVGAWNGAVAIAGPASLAAECAGHVLGIDPHALCPQDVGDAWGELANMIAGNLKALMPPPSRVSLPTIVEGLTYSWRIPGARVINELTFACLGKRIRVTVLEQEADSSPAESARTHRARRGHGGLESAWPCSLPFQRVPPMFAVRSDSSAVFKSMVGHTSPSPTQPISRNRAVPTPGQAPVRN